MALKRNVTFVVSGVTYVMNKTTITMGNEVLILCTRKDFTGDAKIFRYVNNVSDESASTLVDVGVSIAWSSKEGYDSYFEGTKFLKQSETQAYVIVNSDTGASKTKIYQLTKSGASYSIALLRDVAWSVFPYASPELSVTVDGDWIFYAGRNWVDESKLYAYNPVTNASYIYTYPVEFAYSKPSAIYNWSNKIWVANGYAQIVGVGFTDGVGFDTSYVFFNNTTEHYSTPILNLVQPFASDELWCSIGYDYNDSNVGDFRNPFVIRYNGSTYDKYEYSVNAGFALLVTMSVFGVQDMQQFNSSLPISSTEAFVISSNHGNDPNYSVCLYDIVKDDENRILNVSLLLKIPNPNLPIQLFQQNGNNYIVYGYGGLAGGNGNSVEIDRIDLTLPPKIQLDNADTIAKTGDIINVTGLCLFDSDYTTQYFSNVALYRSGNILVDVVKASCDRSSPTLSYVLNVTEDMLGSEFLFKATVVNGPMNGIEIASNSFKLMSVADDIGYGHIGAFYFGGDYTNAIIESIDIPTVSFSVIDFSRDSSITITVPRMDIKVPDGVSFFSYSPFDFDFSGTPVVGSSPLKVNFQAYNYTPKDKYATVWEVYEFWWWFDYANYPDQYVITTTDNTSHVYCNAVNGGRKFDVKLCVKYRLKNQ